MRQSRLRSAMHRPPDGTTPIGLFHPPYGNVVQRLVTRLGLGAADPGLSQPDKN